MEAVSVPELGFLMVGLDDWHIQHSGHLLVY